MDVAGLSAYTESASASNNWGQTEPQHIGTLWRLVTYQLVVIAGWWYPEAKLAFEEISYQYLGEIARARSRPEVIRLVREYQVRQVFDARFLCPSSQPVDLAIKAVVFTKVFCPLSKRCIIVMINVELKNFDRDAIHRLEFAFRQFQPGCM